MGFPILPLFTSDDELKSIVTSKPYVSLTGQALLDLSSVSIDAAVSFIERGSGYNFVCGLLNSKTSVSDDDIVRLLNNGVSVLFVETAEQAKQLTQLGVPQELSLIHI